MQDIITLERRITSALMRIGTGVEAVLTADQATRQQAKTALHQAKEESELAAMAQSDLVQALAEVEVLRNESNQLQQSLAQERAAAAQRASAQDEELLKLKQLLDNQSFDLQRMRKAAVALREELRSLREAQDLGLVDGNTINHALQVELDALRATHLSELAELAELSAALESHLTEAESA